MKLSRVVPLPRGGRGAMADGRGAATGRQLCHLHPPGSWGIRRRPFSPPSVPLGSMSPHRGSHQVPKPIALPHTLCYHRVPSGSGGLCLARAQGEKGDAGRRKGLVPARGSSRAAAVNGPRQPDGPEHFMISACRDVFEKSFQSLQHWWNRKEGNN